ncbi:MAG TPA: hypothetical protein VKQ31_02475, partial [Steroidobacteraceae bacterium]|nr:hypothetical protein [Steroidobacteraceae bacterium]
MLTLAAHYLAIRHLHVAILRDRHDLAGSGAAAHGDRAPCAREPKVRHDTASRALRVLLVSFDAARDTPVQLDRLARLHRTDSARWSERMRLPVAAQF